MPLNELETITNMSTYLVCISLQTVSSKDKRQKKKNKGEKQKIGGNNNKQNVESER